MADKIDLLNFTLESLKKMLKEWNISAFRAVQIFDWIYCKGKDSFFDMANLPLSLRKSLDEKCRVGILNYTHKLISSDGTIKYLFNLSDENTVESVKMKYRYGHSACLSTQVGCRMGCAFCASTKGGLLRNLTAGEMVGQLIGMQKDTNTRIRNIVLMGIGEPFDNYENVMDFLDIVHEEKGFNIGYRKITISTCGLVPEMKRFIKERRPVNLSVSLHAPNDYIRKKIMPIAKRYSIDKILDTCKLYTEETGRRITFEYALISGVNDDKKHALELTEKIRGMLCHVNLIPLNTVSDSRFLKSSTKTVQEFMKVLEKAGIKVTVRRELGSDIEAACGQLRQKNLQMDGVFD